MDAILNGANDSMSATRSDGRVSDIVSGSTFLLAGALGTGFDRNV